MRSVLRQHRWSAIAATVIALVASTVAWESAAAAPPSRPALAVKLAPGLRESQVAESVAYLRAQYGVTTAEALRRLDLQREATGLDQALRSRYPGAYGGMWLDQRAGGVLRVAATSPSVIAAALRAVPDAAHLATYPVRYTLAQLTATRTRLDTELNAGTGLAGTGPAGTGPADTGSSGTGPGGTGPGGTGSALAEIAVDEVNNVVAVYQRAGAAIAGRTLRSPAAVAGAERAVSVPDRRLSAAVAASGGEAVLRQLVIGDDKSGNFVATTPPPCSPKSCAPPIRGGMRLDVKRTKAATDPDDENPLWGECTVGFNVTDASGGSYILTAGHCVVGPNAAGVNSTYDNARHIISTESTSFENGPSGGTSAYPVDYSIEKVADYTRWLKGFPKNGLDVYCTANVSTEPCTSKTISITGYVLYSAAMVGTVVCMTGSGDNDPNNGYHSSGATPGTRCGEITGKNGGIKTNICSRNGDSGGPLFSEATGLAYGILNDGTAGSGNCPTNPPGTEWSQFSPIDRILANVRAKTERALGKNYGFRLRTTS